MFGIECTPTRKSLKIPPLRFCKTPNNKHLQDLKDKQIGKVAINIALIRDELTNYF